MNLLITYIGSLLVAQSLAVGVGLIIDHMYSSNAGLIVFIALYFLMFVVAWKFAVRLTEPKSTPTAPAAPTSAP